jgi:hypothetical protein
MIGFNLRLAARSMRWLGPVLIASIWTSFTVANPGPALSNASNSFMMLVAATCWITVAIGNVDDDGHRELLAAAVGSPARLQRVRAISAYLAANAIALVATVADVAAATSPTRSISQVHIVGGCLFLQLAATAIGVSIGTVLHRPVVRNAGATLLVATAGLVGVILLPPVQHVLRQLNDGRTGGLIALTLVALTAGATTVAAAGALADRRN